MLSERRIFPAIDMYKSGTRREDLLFSSSGYQSVVMMCRMLDMLNDDERTAVMVECLGKNKSNKEFVATLRKGDYDFFGIMINFWRVASLSEGLLPASEASIRT